VSNSFNGLGFYVFAFMCLELGSGFYLFVLGSCFLVFVVYFVSVAVCNVISDNVVKCRLFLHSLVIRCSHF